MQFSQSWRIIQNARNDEASVLLSQDPIWNSFALADLEMPLRSYSQFAIASQNGSSASAICLILRHPIIGQVISPFGNEQGVAEILRVLDLPANPLIQAQERHVPLLQRYYQPEADWRKMYRMAATASSFQPSSQTPPGEIKRLTMADLPALEDLYRNYGENVFPADLFSQGVFFGAYDNGRMIAAGGTHVVIPAHQLAVLGFILTAPDARRQGYATAITAALVTSLLEQYCTTIVLNVFQDNSNAFRVYTRLGFQIHHELSTGKARLLEKIA